MQNSCLRASPGFSGLFCNLLQFTPDTVRKQHGGNTEVPRSAPETTRSYPGETPEKHGEVVSPGFLLESSVLSPGDITEKAGGTPEKPGESTEKAGDCPCCFRDSSVLFRTSSGIIREQSGCPQFPGVFTEESRRSPEKPRKNPGEHGGVTEEIRRSTEQPRIWPKNDPPGLLRVVARRF